MFCDYRPDEASRYYYSVIDSFYLDTDCIDDPYISNNFKDLLSLSAQHRCRFDGIHRHFQRNKIMISLRHIEDPAPRSQSQRSDHCMGEAIGFPCSPSACA